MSTHLDGLIDRFLEDHRDSHRGGWAQITPEDVANLRELIQWLIELKCEPDADGDYPIEVHLVNRRTHERMHYRPTPYPDLRNMDDVLCGRRPFTELARVLTANIRVASERLDIAIQREDHTT